ncbi:hypothetical protein, partial [Streptomyces halstedii]|uniref:hypothetical protein n=1 Tax=Streptomyces halstedii TaxID=1944 RepID=UPI0034605BF9
RHHAQPRHDRLNQQVIHHVDLPTPTLLQQPLGAVARSVFRAGAGRHVPADTMNARDGQASRES